MGELSSFCCFPMEIAVRIVGTVHLILYAFVFTFLSSGVEETLKNVKIRIILGFDSRFFAHSDAEKIDSFLVICLIYSAIWIISSTLLLCASVTKQRSLTLPWLICSTANVIAHMGSFALLATSNFSTCDKWVTLFGVLYTVLVIYFSIVVLVAQYSWRVKERRRFVRPKGQEIWQDVFRTPLQQMENPGKNPI